MGSFFVLLTSSPPRETDPTFFVKYFGAVFFPLPTLSPHRRRFCGWNVLVFFFLCVWKWGSPPSSPEFFRADASPFFVGVLVTVDGFFPPLKEARCDHAVRFLQEIGLLFSLALISYFTPFWRRDLLFEIRSGLSASLVLFFLPHDCGGSQPPRLFFPPHPSPNKPFFFF